MARETIKLCVDCKHYKKDRWNYWLAPIPPRWFPHMCLAQHSRVTGEAVEKNAEKLRMNEGACGLNANWWEPK
jgi:hypothetical protein